MFRGEFRLEAPPSRTVSGEDDSAFDAYSLSFEDLVIGRHAVVDINDLRGYVEDSGEGGWTVAEAIDKAVPAPVISAALFARFASRQEESPAMRAVASLRAQFGGHAVHKA